MNQRAEHGLSFGPAAQLYDAIRPSYPPQAVAWALAPLGPGTHRIADIGAGTGIMTRLLLYAGHDVVAVEPDRRMREQLIAVSPAATTVEGAAESMPLPDASLDGAVAAGAYHWFDREHAHRELARVIRPGGVFAAIWNNRDESVAWVAAYSGIIAGDRLFATSDHHVADCGDGFGPVEAAEFRHITRQTPEGLVRLLMSRSYYLRATPQRQAYLERAVRDLTRTHPDLVGQPEFDLPYVTGVFRARRLGSSHRPDAGRSA